MPESAPWRDLSLPLDKRVEALLAAMDLEEKLAQLGSHWPLPEHEPEAGGGDVAPMEQAFQAGRRSFTEAAAHGLGHLTRVFGSEPVPPAAGAARLRARQRHLTQNTRLGIPALAHEECLTGFTTLGATVYPAAIAWAATFSPDLVHRMASAIARDMRSVGVHQGLSPVLDVVRDYRWGRVEETMGEDPYLVATLGTAYVRGLEENGIVATLKHFAGYSASRAGRNHAPVSVGWRELADVLLPPFEMAVRGGGARSVMNSYSDVDGLPAAAHQELLTAVLRDQWGFTGTVVSDYWAIPFLDLTHRVTPSRAASGALALHSGIDIELPAADAYVQLRDLVAAGEVPEELVDRSVRRVLRQKAELGLLDPSWQAAPTETDDGAGDGAGTGLDLDPPGNRALARELAERSVILLDNGGGLPLAADVSRIAVVGPCGDDPRTFLGCYSFPNHVLSRYEDHGTGVQVDSLFTALRAELPAAHVEYAPGVPVLAPDTSGIPAAVEAARRAEVCVVAVGDLASLFGRGTSGEGCDAADLSLPGEQERLVEAVLASGTPVVLTVVSGRPYALGDVADRCAAVVQAFLPGEEGGAAIAGVLAGRINPSGHLPVGVPGHRGGQPGTYLATSLGRYSEGVSNLDPSPRYPFGHGGSYTRFAYEHLRLSATTIPADGELTATLDVRNTGDREGADVVQLYLTDHVAQVTRPVRELVGYARVSLAAGAACRVRFRLHADRTSFTGRDHQRVVEPGAFTLAVGHSSEELPLSSAFEITGAARTLHDARVMTTPVDIEATGVTGRKPAAT
ncbi:glycoside hydrolase family 3 C-terminal domain-containing protein [Streptomyces sp. N2-109]|uniref:Glycoside hydrolase family 3 C-terminal domain-containing protein n=1 Tax=Streptomyces gossypii TaxID=2883101 RepID=A0ABT2JUZ7_9ACTN|nr:glycoside hydrolase family 3 N-terminal domain-containing protein [Streptomyces gossypii]MCT2591718.1 glycoside hydrolase family 3 C-terminal domain-containing protein [Streptomyces gossypii]